MLSQIIFNLEEDLVRKSSSSRVSRFHLGTCGMITERWGDSQALSDGGGAGWQHPLFPASLGQALSSFLTALTLQLADAQQSSFQDEHPEGC